MLAFYHNCEPVYIVELHDTQKLQNIVFETVWLKYGDQVKIEILDVYPGTRYKDTALSELLPMGAL